MTETPTDPRRDLVAAAVARWSRQLVDLGGRNTLLWYRDLRAGTLDLTMAHPGGLSVLMAGGSPRLRDLFREDTAFVDARHRARTIAAKSRELLEERGIATLHLAIGMATWELPRTNRIPMAPVLLRSATLRPTTPAQDDFVLAVSPEVELNPVLVHYLVEQRGIALDADQVEALTETPTGFDPHPAYRALEEICTGLPGFSVTPRQVLGTFSYAKLPMVVDLASQIDHLANHDVVAALAGDAAALSSVRSSPPQPDLRVDPRREHLVLDADATQIAAVEAARVGSNLVIQGPPGTGKSQTIANLVAALMADGRRVLFVAEKRAAIDAVHRRLEQVGLSDLVLDLYDGVGSRRAMARELGAAVEAFSQPSRSRPDDGRGSQQTALLLATQRELTGHRDALHERRDPYGVSAFEAQEAVSRLEGATPPPRSKVRLRGETLHGIDRARMEEAGGALARAASLGAWSEDVEHDPWFGARIPTSEDAVRALEIVERYAPLYSRLALIDFADRFDQMTAENLQDHYALDLDFHTFLMQITQNQRLISVHREIMIHTQRLSRHAVKPGAAQLEQDRPEHLAIINALLAGDPPRARQALISHINQSLVTALRALHGITIDEQPTAG